MNIKTIRTVAAALALSMMVSGCATNRAANRPLTPDEQRLREDAEAFNTTVAEGALAGCLVGGLLGLAMAKNKGQGALAGCAAGGVTGGATGYYVAQKQQNYASAERRLGATIVDVRQDNQRLVGMVETNRRIIAADRAKIEDIDRSLAANRISAEQARAQMAAVDDNRAYLEKTLSNLRERQKMYKEAAPTLKAQGTKQQAAELDREIASLETQVKQLEGELGTLVERRKISRVG